MATRIPNAARSAACDAIVDRLDLGGAGSLEIRTGTQPASANDAASGSLLATFTLPATAFGSASNGVATANAISGTTGSGDGTAGWFRAKSGGGATVIDGSVGTTGEDLNLNTTTISTGVNVSITSWTVTMPGG